MRSMKAALIAAGLMLGLAMPAYAQSDSAATSSTDTSPTADSTPDATGGAVHGMFTLDTPIKDLIADPGAKAVLDKDLPGLSSDENLAKFQDKSLRQFQPMTGGQLTDELLAKVGSDFAAMGGDGMTAASIPAADKPVGDTDAPAGR
jgi:hypothetical protein